MYCCRSVLTHVEPHASFIFTDDAGSTFVLITFVMIKRIGRWERRGKYLFPTLQTHISTHASFMLITAFTITQTVITPFMQWGDPWQLCLEGISLPQAVEAAYPPRRHQ